jgi:glutaredoxin
MSHVIFYTRADCPLCRAAWNVLLRVQKKIPFTVETFDIDSNPIYAQRYGDVIPVITCNGIEIARSFVEEKVLFSTLQKQQTHSFS